MGRFYKLAGFTAISATLLTTSAIAGGFDRGGVNIDQLFDRDRFSTRAGVTYVAPQRTIKNINNPAASATAPTAVNMDSDFIVPRIGFKANITEGVDCLATYSEPYGGMLIMEQVMLTLHQL